MTSSSAVVKALFLSLAVNFGQGFNLTENMPGAIPILNIQTNKPIPPGGAFPYNLSDPEQYDNLKHIVLFATDAVQAKEAANSNQQNYTYHSVLKLVDASSQVVAGRNYFVVFTVGERDCTPIRGIYNLQSSSENATVNYSNPTTTISPVKGAMAMPITTTKNSLGGSASTMSNAEKSQSNSSSGSKEKGSGAWKDKGKDKKLRGFRSAGPPKKVVFRGCHVKRNGQYGKCYMKIFQSLNALTIQVQQTTCVKVDKQDADD